MNSLIAAEPPATLVVAVGTRCKNTGGRGWCRSRAVDHSQCQRRCSSAYACCLLIADESFASRSLNCISVMGLRSKHVKPAHKVD